MTVTQTTAATRRIVSEAQRHDSGNVAMIATDTSGIIVYWNECATALYGWEATETIGRNILDVTPTHHTQDEAARIMESLRAGKPWSGHFILKHRDGSPMLLHVTDVPVMMAGAVVGVIGTSEPSRQTPQYTSRIDG